MNGRLRCQISVGMFSNERIIKVKVGRTVVEYLVPDQFVHEQGNCGWVDVRIRKNGTETWAVLPTPYSESIQVPESELISA